METSLPQPLQPQKKSNKNIIMAVGAIVAVCLLIGGSALAFVWYGMSNSPEKQVIDALANTFKAESIVATVDFEGKDKKAKLDGSLKLTQLKDGKMSADATFSLGEAKDNKISLVAGGDGSYYAKIADILPFQGGNSGASAGMFSYMKPIFDKFANKWIVVTSKDMSQFDAEDSPRAIACLQQTFKAIQNDSQEASSYIDAFKSHQFMKVVDNLGEKDGSNGFVLEVDTEKGKEFLRAIKSIDSYKQMVACNGGKDPMPSDEIDEVASAQERIEVWITKDKREFSAISYDDVDVKLTIKPTFNDSSVTVNVPNKADALTINELKKEVEATIVNMFAAGRKQSAF